jgi:hypothetical protein
VERIKIYWDSEERKTMKEGSIRVLVNTKRDMADLESSVKKKAKDLFSMNRLSLLCCDLND